ncbi:response regulator [Chitinispirillales bacterium ANBcel5]|uniref:ATP-binding response regulator n=1 Tax=Cellulosispirillum alkaliphilum TaxID=3039283 RepID=UPI002A58B69E|nr:response regulator [Chitinispirillales bacterium ANBcel5]
MSNLRILMVEDNESDALLIDRHLSKHGFDFSCKRVDKSSHLKDALKSQKWDIVITDYTLPEMNGLDTLKIIKDSGLDIPIIMVSGNIGEDAAVEVMRAGVNDFINKDNLGRLVPAIKRELKELEHRKEHRETMKELEDAREEMELNRRREHEVKLLGKIVSGIAHEVRNPLNAISALLEALYQELEGVKDLQMYKTYINSQVERLNLLMKDLLELGKTDSTSGFERLNFVDLCCSAIDQWNKERDKKTSKVVFHNLKNLNSLEANGDYSRLKQVLFNLFQNASFYSPENKDIDLFLDYEKNDNTILIDVVDQGEGIAPEYLDNIFDPFFTTKKAGTGLGLGIARRIVEAHQGSLMLKNNDNKKGCTAHIKVSLNRNNSV